MSDGFIHILDVSDDVFERLYFVRIVLFGAGDKEFFPSDTVGICVVDAAVAPVSESDESEV